MSSGSEKKQGGSVRRTVRYLETGAGFGGLAVRALGSRLLGRGGDDDAAALANLLGRLKGPIVKSAQLLSSVPGALPQGFADELGQLRENAPPMGGLFVERRMAGELGADWRQHFRHFDLEATAAASLGQVHRAVTASGEDVACKLQYPDMNAIAAADLNELAVLLKLYQRYDRVFSVRPIIDELSERLTEELDYRREAANIRLFTAILHELPETRVPRVYEALSTTRLLTMEWLDGQPLTAFESHSQEDRSFIAAAMFSAWWFPLCRYGMIHADPHLGNYRIATDKDGHPRRLHLFDYGCVRRYDGRFVGAVVELYRALLEDDIDRAFHAYELWGFKGIDREIVECLNLWARFIYGPMLEDRAVAIAADESPVIAGRARFAEIHRRLQEIVRQSGRPIEIPREFVLLDRAAVGLGGVFVRLGAELNFYRLFHQILGDFSPQGVDSAQRRALAESGSE